MDLSMSNRLAIYNNYCENYKSFDDCIYELNEEFFELMFSDKMEVCRATAYGDVDFAYKYICIDVYGNLQSLSVYETLNEIEPELEEIYEHEDVWADYIE